MCSIQTNQISKGVPHLKGTTELQQSASHYSFLKLLIFELTNHCYACQSDCCNNAASFGPKANRPSIALGPKLALQHSITATITIQGDCWFSTLMKEQ
jgi:hypothetical protein